jgi:hypothetical protein
LNVYGYANGDPVNFSDPFGLCVDDDEVCHEMVLFLREAGGATLNDAADRLDKYQGRIYLQEGIPYSGSTNARRMVLNMGPTQEETPDGLATITPGRGDLAILLAHETGHLSPDGSYPGLRHPADDQAIDHREMRAFFELNPLVLRAPVFLNRQRMRR